MMLDKLCEKDKQWREYALSISKDKYLADEIVQEMYLKLYKLNKEVNDFYVILTIRSIFIDMKRNNKECELLFDVPDTEQFEFSDKEVEILRNLTVTEKVYLELSLTESVRKIGKRLNTDYGYIFRTIKKVRDKYGKKKS